MTAHPIPNAALAAHLSIVGKTGAGKTYAARSTVERILASGDRCCIVDPTGVWWGLRLAADGRAASRFPVVIAGGRHGDVPLRDEDGRALARIVGTALAPMILDTSGLTVSARTRLFTDFAEALLVVNWGPLHLVLDEAHLFAPQTRVPDPQSARMVHAANSLVALGRARGLRIMLLTQRPAKLHKDSLTQVETLVTMRLVAPQDRKAVEAWIGDQADRKRGAEIVASLPGLKQGEAWIWAPDADVLARAKFPSIVTFDSMRPEAQGARALPPIDVAAIRAAMASGAPAGAEAPRRSPRAAERRASDDAIAAAEQRGYERGLAEGLRRGGAYAESVVKEIEEALEPALGQLQHHLDLAGSGRWALPGCEESPAPATAAGASSARPLKRSVASGPKTEASGNLNSAARKMLSVLDTNPPVRRNWQQIATLAGLKARGGHFNAGRKALVDRDLVVEDDGLIAIRRPSEGAPAAAIDGAALVEMWAGSLSGAAPRILRLLFETGSNSREAVAEELQLQPRGGHWNAAWKELRDNGLVVLQGETARLAEIFSGDQP